MEIGVGFGGNLQDPGDETEDVAALEHAYGKGLTLAHDDRVAAFARCGDDQALSGQESHHGGGIAVLVLAGRRELQLQHVAYLKMFDWVGQG